MARLRPSVRPSALASASLSTSIRSKLRVVLTILLSLTAFRENSSSRGSKTPLDPLLTLPSFHSLSLALLAFFNPPSPPRRLPNPFSLYPDAALSRRAYRVAGCPRRSFPSRSSHCPERRFASRKARTNQRRRTRADSLCTYSRCYFRPVGAATTATAARRYNSSFAPAVREPSSILRVSPRLPPSGRRLESIFRLFSYFYLSLSSKILKNPQKSSPPYERAPPALAAPLDPSSEHEGSIHWDTKTVTPSESVFRSLPSVTAVRIRNYARARDEIVAQDRPIDRSIERTNERVVRRRLPNDELVAVGWITSKTRVRPSAVLVAL